MRQGLAIAAVLLWIAALVARQWLVPSFANPNQIHIDEATYGESCEHFVPPTGNINRVRRGNATVVALQACNNTDVFSRYTLTALSSAIRRPVVRKTSTSAGDAAKIKSFDASECTR